MRLGSYMRGLGIGMVVTALLMGSNAAPRELTDAQIKEKARALGMVEEGERKLSEILPSSEASDNIRESTGLLSDLIPYAGQKDSVSSQPDMTRGEVSKNAAEDAPKEAPALVMDKDERKILTAPASSSSDKEKKASASSSSDKEKKSSSSSSSKTEEKSPSSSSEAEKKSSSSSSEAEKKSSSSSSDEGKSAEQPVTTDDTGAVSIVITGGETSTAVALKLESAGVIKDAYAFDRFLCAGGYDRRITTGHKLIPRGASEVEIAGILTVR